MQSDVEAFLVQIRRFPDDDAPRLIFADWLEDQAAEQARTRASHSPLNEWGPERGRFIRVQIALARLEEEESRDVELTGLSKLHGARKDLMRQEHELENQFRAEWIAPFHRLATGELFRRGFVEQVNVVARDLIEHAPRLFAAGPLRHIRLLDVGASLPSVFNCPFLSRLTALTINGSYLGTPLARELAGAEHLAGLKSLHLTSNKFDDESIQYLAGSPLLSRLEDLDLGNHDRMGETSAQILAASPHLSTLRKLELANCRLGPVGAEAVAASERFPNLQRLGLAKNDIGIARLQTLTRTNGFLRVPVLDLADNKLSAAGLQVILNRYPFPVDAAANRLRDLDLSNNPLGDDGMRVLAACRHLANLRILRLVNCGISDEGVRILTSSLHLDNLVVIDLSKNPLTDSSGRYLRETSHLRKLRLPVVPIIGISYDAIRALNERFPDRKNPDE